MREHAARSGRLRNFGSVTSLGIVANHLSDGRVTVSREKRERVQKPMGGETPFRQIPVRGADRE
jgi:hypothetical protein